MDTHYFERLYADELRRAEWRMLDDALRTRRRPLRRGLLTALFWLLGAR